MRWALLWALIPCWGPEGLLAAEGELCRAWADQQPRKPFRCPRKRDGPAATFCCGSCRRPYCCAAAEDRLDQPRCGAQPQPGPEAGASPPPLLQILRVMALFCSGVLAFLLGFVGLRYLYFCLESCLESFMEEPPQIPTDEIDRSAGCPITDHRQISLDDPPPPYSACVSTGPPSLGAADCQRSRSLSSTLDHETLVQFRRGTPETPGMG
ncbi:protein shisa-1 [Pogona vitticeps]